MNFIEKVIMSCKTQEQLDICRKWIYKVRLPQYDCVFTDLSVRLQYEGIINDMERYLERVHQDENGIR
jgi:hypothetical protein